MKLNLQDLGSEFAIKGLNMGNASSETAADGKFEIKPGTYLLIRKGVKSTFSAKDAYQNILLGDFVAPPSSFKGIFIKHVAHKTASAQQDLVLHVEAFGLNKQDSIYLELNNAVGEWKTIGLKMVNDHVVTAVVPSAFIKPGLLTYKMIVKQADGNFVTFPGNITGNPYAWDTLETESYQTYIAAKNAQLEIFNPSADRNQINIYNPDWKNNKMEFTSSENPLNLELRLSMNAPEKDSLMGFQTYIADYLEGRVADVAQIKTLVIRLKSNGSGTRVKIGMIDTDAHFFSKAISANQAFQEIEIPLNQFKADQQLLLPRPYPGFLPLYYQSPTEADFDLKNMEKLEVTFGSSQNPEPVNLTISAVYLK
jgi:hypothetical protein